MAAADERKKSEFARTELVFGLVAPAGTDLQQIVSWLGDYLRRFKYSLETVQVSDFFKELVPGKYPDHPEHARISSRIDAGNKARALSGQRDLLALAAVKEIFRRRTRDSKIQEAPRPKTVWLVRQIKRPEEVTLLREVYGLGFFLIGANASIETRTKFLMGDDDAARSAAEELIARDEAEETVKYGQRTRSAFQQADVFINMEDLNSARWELERFVDLVFAHPFRTPTRDEYAMFHAYAASVRSADLSRQVGAVILNEHHEIVAQGANDVPVPEGGLFWPEQATEGNRGTDPRDFAKLHHDSNHKRREEFVDKILSALSLPITNEAREGLLKAGLSSLTEFGRSTHAEMEALLACARIGVSPRRGTLYTTTFPCHTCARHVIAAGLSRLVYVEPYPKSLAGELHDEAIHFGRDGDAHGKIRFEPFVGIAARRYLDLFSLTLGVGRNLRRKAHSATGDDSPERFEWNHREAYPRVPLVAGSFLDRENSFASQFEKALDAIAKTQERKKK